MTLKEYIEENGYQVSDLTPEELTEAQKEVEIINAGGMVLDGVFSGYEIEMRKMKREAE